LKKRTKKRSPVCAIFAALGTALLVLLIILCVPFTLPKILHYQAYTVISGSMEPEIPVGSLVYVRETQPAELEKGDVIAFYGGHDSSALITHRVVENRVVMGEIVTKGDANESNDINAAKYDCIVGKVEMTVPGLGILAQFLTAREGKIAAGSLIGLAVILHLAAGLLEKPGDREKNKKNH